MKSIKEIYCSIRVGWITGQAITKEQKGQFQEAAELYLKALRYCTDETSKATLTEGLSTQYWKLGRLEEAIRKAETAQSIYEKNVSEDSFYEEANTRILGSLAAMKSANKPINRTENTSAQN